MIIWECVLIKEEKNMNPMDLMKFAGKAGKFKEDHPKVIAFLKDIGMQMKEGDVLELKYTAQDGTEKVTNFRLTPADIEIIDLIRKG